MLTTACENWLVVAYEGTAGEMLDLGEDWVSSWSRWVFSWVLILRCVAMI